MSFRFYITDLFVGAVIGTDDEQIARDFSASCDYFVIDTAKNKWISEVGDVEVEEYVPLGRAE